VSVIYDAVNLNNFQYIRNQSNCLLVIALLLILHIPVGAQWNHTWSVAEHDLGVSTTLDPYHSYTSVFFQLDKNPDVYVWQEDEFKLYRDILRKSYIPAYGLVEFTLYPTTATSAWIESNHKDLFDRFTVYRDLNLIEGISGGYQEPWSGSLFFGQLATFLTLNDEEELIIAASGAGGLVLTGGLYQIFDNCLVRSNWYRLEWKLKGQGSEGDFFYDWDIKVGFRNYGLSVITNTIMLAVNRCRMNKQRFSWRLGQNSTTEFEIQVPAALSAPGVSRLKLIYGKAVLFRRWFVGLKLGITYNYRRAYDPITKSFSPGPVERYGFILQPFAIW
jgi:hypothetical protein